MNTAIRSWSACYAKWTILSPCVVSTDLIVRNASSLTISELALSMARSASCQGWCEVLLVPAVPCIAARVELDAELIELLALDRLRRAYHAAAPARSRYPAAQDDATACCLRRQKIS